MSADRHSQSGDLPLRLKPMFLRFWTRRYMLKAAALGHGQLTGEQAALAVVVA